MASAKSTPKIINMIFKAFTRIPSYGSQQEQIFELPTPTIGAGLVSHFFGKFNVIDKIPVSCEMMAAVAVIFFTADGYKHSVAPVEFQFRRVSKVGQPPLNRSVR